MSKAKKRTGPVCHDCSHIQIRESEDGATVYWCSKSHRALSRSKLWSLPCRHFTPESKDRD